MGGEYTPYDRADNATALKFWLHQTEASEGDAESRSRAMVYVGEIYEKGLGAGPDYTSAAEWYEKAASAGSPQGKIHLAYLLEQGLGVKQDPVLAVNLYREAAGLKSDELVFRSDQNARIAELTAQLTAQLEERSRTLDQAQAELVEAERRLDAKDKKVKQLNTELADRNTSLQNERARIEGLRAAQKKTQAEIDKLLSQITTPPDGRVDPRALGRRGTNYALIIANARYRDPNYKLLPSVEKDEAAFESVLQRYGFKGHITVVKDGTRESIMSAVAAFSKKLGPTDSAMIYYTGHGAIVDPNSATYWLPSDAKLGVPASWVATSWVTDMIGEMRALHILVVVDSCYAGALVRTANLRMVARSAAQEYKRISTLAKIPSRTVLTSGGREPVAGSTPDGNSVFASKLTEILQQNTKVLDAGALYDALISSVAAAPDRAALQLPRYSILADTDHLNGDFLFVPTS
jgi:TPR repeat protein